MKKFLSLFAAAALLLSMAGQSFGAEVKLGATGFWQHLFTYDINSPDFDSDDKEDNFGAVQRTRVTFTAEANQYVKGSWTFQVGNHVWGAPKTASSGGDMDTNITDFKTRNAWITVKFPDTPLTLNAGLITLGFPFALGNSPVFDGRVAGATLGIKANDQVNLTAIYARPAQNAGAAATNPNTNSIDAYGLLANIKTSMVQINPYVLYTVIGHAAGASGTRYPWHTNAELDKKSTALIGAVNLMANPSKELTLKFDFIYGTGENNAELAANKVESKGFLTALALDYKLDFGTPGFFGWYGSGSKYDDVVDGKEGVLPIINPEASLRSLRMANFGAGKYTMSARGSNLFTRSGVGTYGAGIQVADIKSASKLTHTARVGYVRGTNDAKLGDLPALAGNQYAAANMYGISEDISGFEVDFDSFYRVIDNLEIRLELGVLKPKFKDVSGLDAAWSGQLSFDYSF